jgi:hypothetical protein
VSEEKPTAADVIQFVGRGVRAQHGTDAALAGACFGLARDRIRAIAAALAADDTTSACLYVGAALAELDVLRTTLADHFDRLGVRSSTLGDPTR